MFQAIFCRSISLLVPLLSLVSCTSLFPLLVIIVNLVSILIRNRLLVFHAFTMWFLLLGRNQFFLHPRLLFKVKETVKSLIQFYTSSSICPLPTCPSSRHLAPFHHSAPTPHHSRLNSSSCPVAARIDAVEGDLKIPNKPALCSQLFYQGPQSLHQPEAASARLLLSLSLLGQELRLLQVRSLGKISTKLQQIFME